MGKLYELLAVEGSKKSAFHKILQETLQTFKVKQSHFTQALKVYEPFLEEDQNEAGVAERHDMTTTVHDKLAYLMGFVAPYLDVMYQKEIGNQTAVGTLSIGDQEINGVPATFMLGLENRLKLLRDVIDAVPTLPSGRNWAKDPQHVLAPHVMKALHPDETNRTKKVLVPFELSPATKEHKAQVKELTEDRVIGRYVTEFWSSAYTPKEKSDMLRRLDDLIEQVNTSRMRSNDLEAPTNKIGDIITSYLMGE